MKPKAPYGDAVAVPVPYCAALHTGYALTPPARTAIVPVARMKPKAPYGDAVAVPVPYCAALHTGYALFRVTETACVP